MLDDKDRRAYDFVRGSRCCFGSASRPALSKPERWDVAFGTDVSLAFGVPLHPKRQGSVMKVEPERSHACEAIWITRILLTGKSRPGSAPTPGVPEQVCLFVYCNLRRGVSVSPAIGNGHMPTLRDAYS